MEVVSGQLQMPETGPEVTGRRLPELELLLGTEGLAKVVTETAANSVNSAPTAPISEVVYVEQVAETFGLDSTYNQSNTFGGGGGGFDAMHQRRHFKMGSGRRWREEQAKLSKDLGFSQETEGSVSPAEDDDEED